MTGRTIRLGAWICDHHVDYDLEAIASADGQTRYQVNAAVRGIAGRLHGSELRLQILDLDCEPLPGKPGFLDFVDLPTLTVHGQVSAFKSHGFSAPSAAAVPRYLSVLLGGHGALLPLLPLPSPRGDDEGAGDGDEEAPPAEEPADDGADGDADPRCCPESLDAPSGNLPGFAERDGNRISFGQEPWKVTARYKPDSPCACQCCEYRQEVRGSMTVVAPSGWRIPVDWPLDYEEVTEDDPVLRSIGRLEKTERGLRKVIGMDPETWRLDGRGYPERPGEPRLVGTRGLGVFGVDNPCEQVVSQQQRQELTGKYKVEVKVAYRGFVVDVCNGGARRGARKEWAWELDRDFS